MDLTFHGSRRIFGRTRMRVEDVLSVIENGAAVELGRSDGFIFFLFYSPPDKHTKIALVPENLTCIVSIWESYFNLPAGVTAVSQALNHRARKLLRSFIVSRIGVKNIQNNSRILNVSIDVYEGEKVVYTHYAGEIRQKDTSSKSLIFAIARQEVAKIAQVIQENVNSLKGRVRYCFRISDPETRRTVTQPFLLDHKQIMERLAKTT